MLYRKLFLMLFVSCAAPEGAKKAHEKSRAEHPQSKGSVYSSGANYIPSVFEREKEDTVLVGQVYFFKDNDDFRYPVRFQRIELFKDREKLMDTVTDQSGKFLLKHYLPAGIYQLKMQNEKYSGEMRIPVKKEKNEDIDFKVRRLN